MASPYTPQSIVGYNSSPPADDGSQVVANRITWAGTKTKLADPIKTLAEAIDTAVTAGFAKVLGGVGVTSTAISYQVVGSDQGKLVRASAGGITITSPDATDVGAPFVFALLNNSGSSITFDGSGTQTVDGNLTVDVPAGTGFVIFTDGSNWFTTGRQGTLSGAQLMYGDIINGTITESNGSNAVTFSLKTLAGNDPSATDPVLVCYRSVTATSGIYVYRTVTAATTLTVSSGSTLGTANSTAFRLWLVLFDDAGTTRLGVINCVSSLNIYPLGRHKIASSTAEGGAGAADSAQVFYTGTAVSSKPYTILGYANYESGISTAGSWNASPTVIQLFGRGDPLPGHVLQNPYSTSAAVQTGSTALPFDDTIPTSSEGDQFFSQAITPISAANLLEVSAQLNLTSSSAVDVAAALFQDSGAAAINVGAVYGGSGLFDTALIYHRMLAATTSATTFKVRCGSSAGTTTLNGTGGARDYGGVFFSTLQIKEIMT